MSLPSRSFLSSAARRVLVAGLAATATTTLSPGPAFVHAQAGAARPPVPGAPAGVSAFVGVNVVPMDTERVLADQTVLVEGGRVTALGPAGTTTLPTGAVRIDGRGKYLVPGLGDCHVHLFIQSLAGNPRGGRMDTAEGEYNLLSLLAQGVTTIRNVDYVDTVYGRAALALRARAAAGTLLSPRIYTAGQWAPSQYLKGSRQRRGALAGIDPRPDSVAAYVAAYKAAGYDFIKARREGAVIFDSLAAAARRLGVPIAGHVPPETTIEDALVGMRSIEHLTGYIETSGDYIKRPLLPDTANRIHELAAATVRAGTWNCLTVQAAREWMGERYVYMFTKALQGAGAGLLLGTDDAGKGQITPASELAAMVAAGLTPYQALATGTRNTAAYFNTLDETGTVAPGKRADLVLLSGNPLADVSHVRQPAGVMLGGRWLAREELDRRLAALKAATAVSP
jgi:imidazolonepropionase-like amidohydrolase